MKLIVKMMLISAVLPATLSCSENKTQKTDDNDFKYTLEQFADLKIMRYKVPGYGIILHLNKKNMHTI